MEVLGVERRDRILAALYLARQDAVNVVRQSSVHIWKALVHNTPRTGKTFTFFVVFNILKMPPSARDSTGAPQPDHILAHERGRRPGRGESARKLLSHSAPNTSYRPRPVQSQNFVANREKSCCPRSSLHYARTQPPAIHASGRVSASCSANSCKKDAQSTGAVS